MRERDGESGGCKVHAGREVRGAIAAEGIHHAVREVSCAVGIAERGPG